MTCISSRLESLALFESKPKHFWMLAKKRQMLWRNRIEVKCGSGRQITKETRGLETCWGQKEKRFDLCKTHGKPDYDTSAERKQLHSVWKSQKKSHSTLRVKRASFTFWMDKSSLKRPKIVNFGEFWKTEACGQIVLPDRSLSKGSKINGKCQN